MKDADQSNFLFRTSSISSKMSSDKTSVYRLASAISSAIFGGPFVLTFDLNPEMNTFVSRTARIKKLCVELFEALPLCARREPHGSRDPHRLRSGCRLRSHALRRKP